MKILIFEFLMSCKKDNFLHFVFYLFSKLASVGQKLWLIIRIMYCCNLIKKTIDTHQPELQFH